MDTNVELKPYYEGPGFVAGNPASYDGAKLAAPVKSTQEAFLLGKITEVCDLGLTAVQLWDMLPAKFGEVHLSTIRARLTTLKKAGKIVALPDRRMERFGVSNHAYVLPKYGPMPDEDQGDLWDYVHD